MLPRPVFLTAALAVFLAVPGRAEAQAADTLRLDDAVREALQASPAARIARNDRTLASNDRTLGNAGFLPTLSADGSYNGVLSNTRQTFATGETQDVTGAQTIRRRLGAGVSWTVLDGLGRRFAVYDRLGAEADAQALTTRAALEGVLADVVVRYYDVARQQRQRAVLQAALGVSEERVRIAEVRRDVGTGSELEVRQARLDLNADRAALVRQAATLADARARLGQALGRTRTPPPAAVAAAIPVDRTLAEAALAGAVRQRNPALRAAREQRTAAAAARRALAAERLPTLDATAGLAYSDVNAEAGFLEQSESLDFTYGLALTYDVFDGLNRRRRLENARVRERTAAFAVDDVEARLAADLAALYASYRRRLDLVALETDNVALAADNVDLALERFRLGTLSSLELREIQEQQIAAEGRLVTATFEAKEAETRLLQLGGQLLDRLAP